IVARLETRLPHRPAKGERELSTYFRRKGSLLKRAVRASAPSRLAAPYHPDKQSADVPAGAVQECVQKFIEIDQAWKILGNEETKKAYDLQRREDDLRTVGPVDAQIYLEDMLWNKDDQCFTLSCRCGGKYCVSKDEAEEVNLICCDTCSLIIEIVQHS
uniref:DnaJ heat shock protein family (Hsp40) member C24 n=1 Tax=Sarcophilus harrisii TaxID=9305 RepID=A0A7N4PY88_SARHA